MRCFRSCVLIQCAVLAVVIVEAAELKGGIANRADQTEHLLTASLFDASAIHARINVEKNSHATSTPLADLFVVFGQHGDADL